MEIIPKFEIGIFKGTVVEYESYKFICRLFIPPNRDLATIEWLNKKGASIFYTNFDKPYFIIIFATNYDRLLRTIHNKYKASQINAEILLKEINAYHEKNQKDFEGVGSLSEDRYNYKYYQHSHREFFDYKEYYANALLNSHETGWFYKEETSYSEYEALERELRFKFEDEW
jgi:hypothetical protein